LPCANFTPADLVPWDKAAQVYAKQFMKHGKTRLCARAGPLLF